MGASSFSEFHRAVDAKDTAKKAFARAVEDAKYEHGHGGCSGTIAEKSRFVSVGSVATRKEGYELADKLIEEDDHRISDKWGPAGCIEVEEPKGWIFFGWASS